VKLALPKGRLLKQTASLLEEAGLGLTGYDDKSRSYRPKSSRFPDLFPKVFQEKDIPIQVAIGNYDLGVCGLDWVEELLVKYPSGDLVKVSELGYGRNDLYVVASRRAGISSVADINNGYECVRIVSEYQNLAESFALGRRLRRFSVLPVWGAAEVYPPEGAELAIIGERATGSFAATYDLVPLARILSSTAVLVANRHSLAKANMSRLLAHLRTREAPKMMQEFMPVVAGGRSKKPVTYDGVIRLALPDGHQQRHTIALLEEAGIDPGDYREPLKTRRPTIGVDGVNAKVIRPQDMPLQVANGNFDLAITGEDWLRDHLYRFPSSPVERLLKLSVGRVAIVAVVSEALPVTTTDQLRDQLDGLLPAIRIASEYVNIADRYARDNRLVGYRIIPTWGATEAFLPEDADLLIENTETGQTLKQHGLRIIDTLFESSACLIGNRNAMSDRAKRSRLEHVIEILERTAK